MQQGVSSSVLNQETNQNQKDTRAKIYDALQKFNIKQVDVARQTGIHHSTLSLWLQGKVRGHFIKIQDTLNQWLDNLYSNKPRYTTLNKTIDKQYNMKPPVLTFTTPIVEEIHQCQMIPVTIELEIEGKRKKEYILWNLYEPYLTPEEYTHLLIDENPLYSSYELLIPQSIKKAIEAYLILQETEIALGINMVEPCLRVIELDIQMDNINLKDRFQWDINEEKNDPDYFAQQLCEELALNTQFYVQISHQIREQILNYRKQRVQPTDNALMAMRNKTRSAGQGNDKDKDKDFDVVVTEPIVTEDNYLRTNPKQEFLWEPQIDILDANEIRRYQRLEDRKQRYSRRTRS